MEKVTMEFKNFENKLIIEKITNYCIENNINAQEINALTAKIKFGKLDQNILNEDWKKILGPAAVGAGLATAAPYLGTIAGAAAAIPGAGPAAVGAGAFGAVALGKKLYQRGLKGTIDDAKKGLSRFGNKFSTEGKYKNAIDDVQTNLTTALDSLTAAQDLLGNGPESIFKKYNIVMDDKDKGELKDAVTDLKQAMDKYIGPVKSSLANVNGAVSGTGQSNWDNKPQIPFDKMFPDLIPNGKLEIAYTKAYGTVTGTGGTKNLTPYDKKDLEITLNRSKQNIVKTLQNPNLDNNNFINTINSKVDSIITGFESTDPKENQKALQLLHTIAITNPNSNSNSNSNPDPTPTKPILTNNTMIAMIKGNGNLHDVYKTALTSDENLKKLKPFFEKIYKKETNERIRVLIMKAVNNTPNAKTTNTSTTNADNAILSDLITQLEYELDHG
jgi:hypothetical protein